MKPQILEEHHVSSTHRPDRRLDFRSHAVIEFSHRPAEELLQPAGDGIHPKGRLRSLRTAQVGGEDDRRVVVAQVRDRWQGRRDAVVVRDPSLVEGDVEVDTDEHPPPGDLDVADGLLVHNPRPLM